MSFSYREVNKILELNDSSKVLYLLAVGYPDEMPIMENINGAGSAKYYLDKANCLHVPKLTVDAITEWR